MQIRHRSIAVVILTAIILIGAGWVLRSDRVEAVGETRYDLQLLQRVVNQIRAKYVDDLNEDEAIDAAIRGMLGTLDPYTEFLEKKQNDEMKMMQIQGKYGGLGIKITKQENALVVVALFDDTPAYNAGLQTGDRIVSIGEQSTADIDVSQAADLLRGAPGMPVTISVSRDDDKNAIAYTITRAIITIPVVPYAGIIDDKIGYIKLNQFTEEAGIEVERALKKLQAEGVNGIVFDLRGNPGGLLEQAVSVASKFLDEDQLVVYTKGRNASQEKSYHASSSYRVNDMPLVVLANQYSASASEIVAGAIQDWDRGVVVGKPTFGKALVQRIFPMSEGTAIKITTARYYTPSGRLIQRLRNREEMGKQTAITEIEETDEDTREVYKTSVGRTVYGGGGIMPDFEAALPVYPRLVAQLSEQNMFIKFVSQYTVKHPELDQASFQVTDAMMNEFRRFVSDKSFVYKTEAEQTLGQLEEVLQKKDVSNRITETIKTLRAQLKGQQDMDYTASRDLITARIGTEISAKLWGSTGRYAFGVKHDPQIQAAVGILQDKARYQQQLSVAPN
jgi:carboxyl-terminal processing protease